VYGTVARLGSAEPIDGVQVTLGGGPADARSVQELIRAVANRGIVFAPAAIGTVDEILQALADTAATQGVATNFPAMRDAVAAFRATNAQRFAGVSDSMGQFTIADVLPGQYTVQSEREGFFETSARPRVTVGGNQTVTVAVSLIAGATISGTVRNSAGQPQRDMDVLALSMTYQNGYPVLFPVVSKATNDRGEYRLFWLQPGEYYIAASPRQFPPGQNPNVPRAQSVRTFYPNTADFATTVPVVIKGGEQLPGMNIDMQNFAGVRISGKITSLIPSEESTTSGNTIGAPPLVMMLVARNPNTPDVTGNGGGQRTPPNLVFNPATGEFSSSGVPPGSYDLFARIPESNANGGAGLAFGHVPIDVAGEDINGLSITVGHTVPVSGIVTVDGNAPQRNSIRVALQPYGSSTKLGVYQSVTNRAMPVDADGNFTIISVPAGHYRVQAGPGLSPDLYLADATQGASILDSGFDVGLEPPNPLRLVFKSGAAAIDGTVQDDKGKAVPNATVVLIPLPARRDNRALYHVVTSDPAGRFTMRSVAPGNYKLFAWKEVANGAYYNAGFLARYEQRGRPVTVNEKSTATEQITVIPSEP
jgi:hypothetical protein